MHSEKFVVKFILIEFENQFIYPEKDYHPLEGMLDMKNLVTSHINRRIY
jgi:hypothetical protein